MELVSETFEKVTNPARSEAIFLPFHPFPDDHVESSERVEWKEIRLSGAFRGGAGMNR